ncbi:MAG TPA: zinc-ribbon domain-containing protein [Candidatus Onthovivens sp.]|nr:zinc-ribbon domain-containing protein [Candidatus Onthovivens sp.]
MYCQKCGKQIADGSKFCEICGAVQFEGGAQSSGVKMNLDSDAGQKKLLFGLLGIFLGSLGIHYFIIGNSSRGVTYLLITLLTFGVGAVIMGLISLIEGIIALTMSDEAFSEKYLNSK